MQTLSNDRLIQIRNTIQTLKEANAFSGHPRLAYAADKTLGNVNDALEPYQEQEQRLAEEHQMTDGKDRPLWRLPSGEVVAEEEVELEEGEGQPRTRYVHVSGEKEGQEADFDRALPLLSQKFDEEVQQVREEKSEVEIHQVPEELLWENLDLDGQHSDVDLTHLEPMLKSDE